MSSVSTRFDSPASAPPPPPQRHALAPGTCFGEFEILRVLGVGGFGIVYLARDHALQRDVALKEYMPASLAARGVGARVTIRSPSFAATYASGLDAFVNEARLLARFDHPSLVKVHRGWEDNGTAYMVMPYLKGVMLGDTRRAMASPPDEAWLRRVVEAMLGALELLHRDGVYHRDVAPENILLPAEGPPVLLDFGAARHAIGNTQSFTTMLRLDYAPIEQFVGVEPLHQGPWTDLYALGAVMHFLVFGVPPAPATERAVQGDDAEAMADRSPAGISPQLLEAMAWALAVRPSRRPQSAKELRGALDGRIAVPGFARRRPTSAAGLVASPAADTVSSTAHERVIPLPAWPTSFKGWRIDRPHLPSALRPRRARMAPMLVLALLGLLVVGVMAVGWKAQGRADAGAASVAGVLDIVATTSTAPLVSVETLAPTADVAGSSPPAAVAAAAMETPVAAAPMTSPRVARPAHAPTRAGTRSSASVHASARSASSAHRAVVPERRLARAAPTKRPRSTTAVTVARARPPLKGTADVYLVTSNAYTERSGNAAILNERGRGPAPPGQAETAHASAVAEALGSASALATQGPTSAREACGGRGFFARTACMDRECEKPLFRDSAECSRILAMKRGREGH